MFGVCVNFKIRAFQWSAVQLCGEIALGKGGAKDSYHNYCRQQHQSVSRTAQLSDDSTGPTCIADLDSGALALTNAQNRPALLQLNRPLGTAVSNLNMPNDIPHDWCTNRYTLQVIGSNNAVNSQQCDVTLHSVLRNNSQKTTNSYCIYSMLADSKNNARCYLYKSPYFQ